MPFPLYLNSGGVILRVVHGIGQYVEIAEGVLYGVIYRPRRD